MTATLLADRSEAKAYHASWQELLEVVPRCDALIVDAPYSERTHAGHNSAASSKNEEAGVPGLRTLDYGAWSDADVRAFVEAWSPRTDGWFVSITDHCLAPSWAAALEAQGRYVFSPLACVEPGSRVRVVGDGPSQWSCFAIVARPRNPMFMRWGTLPGAYVTPNGQAKARGSSKVVGGKGAWLMERLIEDYSRPGQIVVDPCCGAGTTLTAALRTGRRAIGGDAMLEHAQLAAAAISRPTQIPLFLEGAA